MDIARLAIVAGVLGFALYGLWWLARRVQTATSQSDAPDALRTFNELVGALKSKGKMDAAVEASVIALREAVSEIVMPLDSDGEVRE